MERKVVAGHLHLLVIDRSGVRVEPVTVRRTGSGPAGSELRLADQGTVADGLLTEPISADLDAADEGPLARLQRHDDLVLQAEACPPASVWADSTRPRPAQVLEVPELCCHRPLATVSRLPPTAPDQDDLAVDKVFWG